MEIEEQLIQQDCKSEARERVEFIAALLILVGLGLVLVSMVLGAIGAL